MKSLYTKITAVVLSVSLLFSSCNTNLNNTQKGAGVGAAAGAVLGGILGNNIGSKDNAALGAIIGAAVGGVAGGVIGKKMDKQAAAIENAIPGAQVERVGEGIRVVLGENAIRFDTNKSTLTQQAQNNLNNIIKIFKEYPDTNINITGYTDSTGSADYNLKLSQQRAQAVANYLEANGVSASRIKTQGLGIADPIGDNSTADGKAMNRRVEFGITANAQMVQQAEQGQ